MTASKENKKYNACVCVCKCVKILILTNDERTKNTKYIYIKKIKKKDNHIYDIIVQKCQYNTCISIYNRNDD